MEYCIKQKDLYGALNPVHTMGALMTAGGLRSYWQGYGMNSE
jgi:hypothetical protein